MFLRWRVNGQKDVVVKSALYLEAIHIHAHLDINIKGGDSYAFIFIVFPSETSQKPVNMLSSLCINMKKPHSYAATLGYRLILKIAYLGVRFNYVGLQCNSYG